MPTGPATVFNVSSKYSLTRMVSNVKCKFTVITIIYVNADLPITLHELLTPQKLQIRVHET